MFQSHSAVKVIYHEIDHQQKIHQLQVSGQISTQEFLDQQAARAEAHLVALLAGASKTLAATPGDCEVSCC